MAKLLLVKKLPFNYSGLSIYPFIIIQKDKYCYSLVKHEIIHIYQAKRQGIIIFWIRYLINYLLVGYNLNPFELEASGIIKPHYKLKLKNK